jgi:tetratricopeptide (TPR) repeat protein
MVARLRNLFLLLPALALTAGLASAQTTALEGEVKGEDGKPLKGAWVIIERKDIKGYYYVETDKKGKYLYMGLPLGTYKVTLNIGGAKDKATKQIAGGQNVDFVDNVRTRLGDPLPVNFDLSGRKARQEAMAKAIESGQGLTAEQSRELSKEQREQIEKQMKERQAAMAKNKALNDAFNAGKEAAMAKNWDVAIEQFNKAAELDATQHVIFANLGDAYGNLVKTKTGAEQEDALNKGIAAYQKAIELKPDDAAYHNNFALLLANGKKFDEAKAELTKAAQLDPTNAGRYFFNLGAVLVNTGNLEPAGEAFKRAIEADPNYADAHYQYGIYLLSKASTTADGKVVPVPGTAESFQKYLELRPDGPFAQSAKDMLTTLGSTIETKFVRPGSEPQKKSAPKKKN